MLNHQSLSDTVFSNVDLEESVVCLHSSFSKVKHLFHTPVNLIDYFFEKGCTLVVPAHNYKLRVWYNPSFRILQNGLDLKSCAYQSSKFHYMMKKHDISPDMGIVAENILLRDDSVIGHHPENAFASSGPEAESIIHTQSPWNVYSPYDCIMTYDKVFILLLGVDLSKATPVHYAEYISGRKPFIRWYKDNMDVIRPMRVGGCSDGFNACYPYISHLDLNKDRKNKNIKIYPFREFIEELVQCIRQNPEITHCSNPECPRCRDILKGGPYYSFKEIKL